MLTTWLFEFFHELRGDPTPEEISAHFDAYLDLWVEAERRGFDGIFFSEHHFGAGYSPSPNLLVSHLAALTTTLRLGVLGTVGPYATPWRVVEEFAMLDQLTRGRMEMGIVSGIPPEFISAGLSIPEMAARHAEVCAVLDAARRGGPVSHHGTHWSFDNLRFLPPFRSPNPPIWTAVRGEESARRAARRGWKVCSGFNSVANLVGVYDAYREEAATAGFEVGPGDLGIRRMVHFVDRPSEAREGRLKAKQALLEVLNASVGPLPPFAAILDRPDEDDDHLSNEEFIAGTPSEVAEQLIHQATTLGAGHVMVMFSDLEPAALHRAHEVYATEVIPALHAISSD